jgi:hypothetical protein
MLPEMFRAAIFRDAFLRDGDGILATLALPVDSGTQRTHRRCCRTPVVNRFDVWAAAPRASGFASLRLIRFRLKRARYGRRKIRFEWFEWFAIAVKTGLVKIHRPEQATNKHKQRYHILIRRMLAQ